MSVQVLRLHLTAAVQSWLTELELPAAVTINITLALEDARGHDAYDDGAPATYPRNATEQAIDDAITNTPAPARLPGTPLDRLENSTTPDHS